MKQIRINFERGTFDDSPAMVTEDVDPSPQLGFETVTAEFDPHRCRETERRVVNEIERVVRERGGFVDKVVVGVEEYSRLYALEYGESGSFAPKSKIENRLGVDELVVVGGSLIRAVPSDPGNQLSDYVFEKFGGDDHGGGGE